MIKKLLDIFTSKPCLNCESPKIQEFYSSFDDDRRPYIEVKSDDHIIRTFFSSVPEHLYKWHTDEEDRIITVLNDTDFKFMFDNELPQRLYKDKQIKVPKGTFHRLIKGSIPVAIKIEKLS